MAFVKGQSGNPGGWPKDLVEVQDAPRAHTAAAVATLARICKDDTAPPAAHIAAANALLDRVWRRPMQAVQATVERMTQEQLVMASPKDPDLESGDGR